VHSSSDGHGFSACFQVQFLSRQLKEATAACLHARGWEGISTGVEWAELYEVWVAMPLYNDYV